MTADIGPALGEAIPDFCLLDENDALRDPLNLTGERGLLLVFVHGTWCANCVPTFYTLAKYAPVYMRVGVNVAVISEDSPASLRNFKASAPMTIPYPLLADEGEAAHHSYRVGTTRLWLLTDPQAVVVHKHIDPDGNHRLSHPALLSAIQAHLNTPPA